MALSWIRLQVRAHFFGLPQCPRYIQWPVEEGALVLGLLA